MPKPLVPEHVDIHGVRINLEVDGTEAFNPVDDGYALNRLLEWAAAPSLQQKILVDNPANLYEFDSF